MSTVPVALTRGRPLSVMQRPLWTSQRLHPGVPVQNMALLTNIDGKVNPDRLADSFDVVVRRCDVLQTRIVETNGSPTVHLDAQPQERQILHIPRARVEGWAAERAAVLIDTAVRAYDSAILVHDDGTVSWYLALHHTITDATSSSLVFEATAAVYYEEPIEPDSYYRWARQHDSIDPAPDGGGVHASASRSARARSFWRRRDAIDPIDRLYRPIERPQAEAARLEVDLDAEVRRTTSDRLQTDYKLFSPDLSWTALLMTATAAYLYALGGTERFSIGLPVHNRSDAATRRLIGPVMEVFPVDVTVEAGDTFRSLHKRVGRAIMTTLANASPGTAPTADHVAVLNVITRAGVGSFGSLSTTTSWVHSGAIDSSHLLRVQFTAYDQTLALDLNRGAADETHLERAGGHFASILRAMVANPDATVIGPVVEGPEAAELLEWERGPDPHQTTVGVVDRLEQALSTRSTVALSDGSSTWTGVELWRRCIATAAWLRRQGVEGGDRVGIEMARSADAVIAILAVLVAGGSFVPLDVTQPPARRRRLADRASTTLVMSELPPVVVDPDAAPNADTATTDPAPLATPAPDDEAYLLFTSGSTGEPKGVPITHDGLARYLHFAQEHYLQSHGAAPVVPLFSSLSFDLTMTSLFLPLLADGRLVVVESEGPAGLSEIAARPEITWAKATPSHLEILARLLPDDHQLATVVVGGEAFGAGLAKRLLAVKPGLTIYNEYGPTEAVVGCMIHRVDPNRLDDHREVPIGVPAPGVTLRVVGPNLDRVPLGCAGELCISHPGVTAGYLDEAEITNARFVELDGRRFYRSGDLVRLADAETLIYLGRIDEQVKVGGIRLEPTEVEDALTSHPAIKGAAVRLWSPTVAEPETRCVRCGLDSNVPGVEFDATGVCSACTGYDRVAPQVESWFRTVEDLQAKRDQVRSRRQGSYDCLHLLSGGKDSTYALYRLVDLGFEPYVLTLDNGFISPEALDNARRSVAGLGLDHEFATTEAMNEIFRDSLERHSNVCHGCYKTLYTLATNRAAELGIPMIVTGLSRGQLFETRLLPQQFNAARFDPDAIDRAIIEARKAYHRLADGPNRLLDTTIFGDDELFEQIEYLDFYRYVDVELADLYAYLDANAPWVRPTDTGRSTNCLINAAGIYTHIQEQGYHNYAIPYAWDVRLGHKTRAEAIEELDDQLQPADVEPFLTAVGYTPNPSQTLTAWIETTPGTDMPTPGEIRTYLSETLGAHAIPRAFVTVDELPLSVNGKLDTAALPAPERTHRASSGIQVAAETELEATIVSIWEQVLRIEPIGVDDDFFALGGDSLGALEMNVAVAEATGLAVSDDFAFIHTTPRELASAIDAAGGGAGEPFPLATEPPPTESDVWSSNNPPPLSAGELGILFEQRSRPGDIMFNVGRMAHVAAQVDGDRFAGAVRAVAATHVPLSWSYSPTRRQLTSAEAVTIDLATKPISADELATKAEALQRSPIDLKEGPLLKVLIQPLEDGSTAIVLVCHHLSGDAESFDRLWSQLDAHYQGHGPIEVPIDYPTFTRWQNESITEADRGYWLDVAAPSGSLSLSRPPMAEADGSERCRADVSPRQLKAANGTTAFATAVTALAATLRRYSQGDHLGLAMVASSRNHPVADPIVGYFLNTLPLNLPCSPRETLREMSASAATAIASNLGHRNYPYSRIVSDRRDAGLATEGPEILVVYEKLPSTTLAGLPVEQTILSSHGAVADATFLIIEGDDTIELELEFRSTLFDRATAHQVLRDFNAVLSAAVHQPDLAVADVELPSLEASVLHGGNLDHGVSVLADIEHNIKARAGEPAVECDGQVLSWSALGERSNHLAQMLLAAGVEPGMRVIVNLPRSLDLIAAIVAVGRVGGAYVPIDPTYPAERIELIATRSRASAAFVAEVRSQPLTPNDINTGLDNTGLDNTGLNNTGPEAVAASGQELGHDAPFAAVEAGDPAYVIFTSGSTGTPRGVPVSHGQLAASTAARASVYDETPERFLVISSSSFDSSIAGIFWTLATGGTIVLPTDRESHDPDELLRFFSTGSISHTLLVPSLYQALLERGRLLEGWPTRVIVAGEACPAALVSAHFKLRAPSALTNEYGPTETTVWATAQHLAPTDDRVPIGGPIPGTWVAVVDESDRLVPPGAVGQLIVGGAGLVDGYDDDDAATKRRFDRLDRSAIAQANGVSEQRFFRTGDRAVVGEGNVYFLGRIDHQLNVGGVRAEPEDIERVLLSDPSVGAAVVTAIDPRPLEVLIDQTEPVELGQVMVAAANDEEPAASLRRRLRHRDGGHLRLVAYLEPTPLGSVDLAAVQRLVADRLPALLRPTAYGVRNQLPRTPNGKIDRAAAAELDPPAPASASPSTLQPAASTEGATTSLAALFAETLGLESVGPSQSFFELGGHSLLAMELLARLENRYGAEVTVSSLYDHPTPESMATLLDELIGNGRHQNRFLIPIQPNGTRPPIFAVHVLGVNSEYYRPLAARLGPDQPLFGLGQPTLDLDTDTPTDVAQVAALYRQELTRTAPSGPITLTAVSRGAVVAYELAQQLKAAGRNVALLALFDSVGPAAEESTPSRTDRLAIHRRELTADPALYLRDRGARLRERADRWGEIALGKARATLGLPLADDLRIRRFIEDNWRSQISYQFAPYYGTVAVFKAMDDVFTAPMANSGMGWQHVVKGPLEVIPVAGQHLSMLAEPDVETLAQQFADRQAQALEAIAAPASASTWVDPQPSEPATGEQATDEPTTGETEAELISALQRGRLGDAVARIVASERILDPVAQLLVDEADDVTRWLAAEAGEMANLAVSVLEERGIGAAITPIPDRVQHLSFEIRLTQPEMVSPSVAIDALATLGYQTQDLLSEGAWQAYIRTHSACTLIRTDASTTRLTLSWGAEGSERSEVSMRPWQPRRAGGDLGVFLGTPKAMVPNILALAEPTETDLVVDIGCGDGRVLIEAVERFGCRARGIENDPRLAALARAAVTAAGLDDRVEIIEANASTLAGEVVLAGASIVFLFLPGETVAAMLPAVLSGLGDGGRVVAHEQTESVWPVAPDRSRLVIDAGVTVAHLWTS